MIAQLKETKYAPTEFIIRQGEVGDQFFIVKEGEVECLAHPDPNPNPNPNPNPKPNPNEVECHVDGKLVKLVGTGEYFGERALLTAREM